MVALPESRPEDDEDVVWGLSTASALWARGERRDAIVWLRRAADAAVGAGQEFRGSELGMYAGELEDVLNAADAAVDGALPSEPAVPSRSAATEPVAAEVIELLDLEEDHPAPTSVDLEAEAPPPQPLPGRIALTPGPVAPPSRSTPPPSRLVAPPPVAPAPQSKPITGPPPPSTVRLPSSRPKASSVAPPVAAVAPVVELPPPAPLGVSVPLQPSFETTPLPSSQSVRTGPRSSKRLSPVPSRKSQPRAPILDPWGDEPTETYVSAPRPAVSFRQSEGGGDELVLPRRPQSPTRAGDSEDEVVTSAAPLDASLTAKVPPRPPRKAPPKPSASSDPAPAPGQLAQAAAIVPSKGLSVPPPPAATVTSRGLSVPPPPASTVTSRGLSAPPPPTVSLAAPAPKVSPPLPPPSKTSVAPAAAGAPPVVAAPPSIRPPPAPPPVPSKPAVAVTPKPSSPPSAPVAPRLGVAPPPPRPTAPSIAPAALKPSVAPPAVVAAPKPSVPPASAPAVKAEPAPAVKVEPPPAAKVEPVPAVKVEPPPAVKVEPPPAVKVEPVPAVKSVRPPAGALIDGVPLDEVDAFVDLPLDMQHRLVALARIEALAADEEVSSFGAALLLAGEAAVCATIVDTPACRAVKGTLVPSRGSLTDAVGVRVVAGAQGARVAIWDQPVIEDALKSCPWVLDELVSRADRIQALAGATMGPLGEVDEAARNELLDRLTVHFAQPQESLVEAGGETLGIVIVGGGVVELSAQGATAAQGLHPGEMLFARAVLEGRPAPRSAHAGASGALVLIGEAKIAKELMASSPPLAALLADATE